ncbi:MAG: phosphotransferase [Pseudomonadota bacterium]
MIPKTIADVSSAWLGEVLGAEIRDHKPTQIGQGVGLMGDIYRVALSYAEANTQAPATVVVKLPSSFEENRAQGVALGMFEAEVRFYRELAPHIAVGMPAIYHAEIEAGTAEFVIVMEDLSALTLVDQSEGMTASQAAAAVKVLASIHAVWWDNAQTPELDWIPTMTGPRIEFVDNLLTQILPVFLDGFGASLPEGGREIYERFAGNYLSINQALCARSPWTLVHQDFRVENLLFGPAGSEQVVVLDWQGIGRGTGAYDLAYVLSGSMDCDLRRGNEETLVRTYHEQLLDSGISGYSFDQLWDDYGHAQLMGGLATAMVTGGSMDLSNERGRQLVETMATRHATAALDHNGLQRLEAITGVR